MASSSRESSASWRPSAPLDSRGVGPRLRGAGRPRRPPRRPSRRHPRTRWRRGRAAPSRARRLVRAPRGPRRGPPSGPSRRCRPGDSGRGSPGACSPRSPRRRRPGRGARRSGSPPALPGVHPSRGVYRPSPSRREPRRRRGACRRRRDARRDRHARARDPEHADALDGLGVRRVVGDRQQDLLEARRRPGRARRGPPATGRGSAWRRSATWRRSGSRGRGRPPASRRAARGSGTRSVSASQIGKSWMTGALPSSGAPMDAICSASTRRCGPWRRRCRRSRQERDREQRRARRSRAAGPSHATGRVQPSRRPSGGDARVERAERGHDQQQHVDRRRGVEEGAPGRRHREQQARREEGQQRHEQDGPEGPVAALPRQREQPDERDRDAEQQQDVEQVVADARRRASRAGRRVRPRGSGRGSAGRSRRRCRTRSATARWSAAWPGSGLPNTAQSRMAHGANTSRLTTATTPIRRTRTAARLVALTRQASHAHARASQTTSLRVSAASADQQADRR